MRYTQPGRGRSEKGMLMFFRFGSGNAVPLALLILTVTLSACDDDPFRVPADNTPPSVSSVEAIDQAHLLVTFNEPLNRISAEEEDHFSIVETSPSAPVDGASAEVPIMAVALLSDQRTVSLTVLDISGINPYQLTVTGVSDAHGNTIAPVQRNFQGSSDADVTPPELVYRSPGANATGARLTTSVTVTFSEPIASLSPTSQAIWTTGPRTIQFQAHFLRDGAHRELVPLAVLEPGTVYTVRLSGITDHAGNTMPTVSWSFTTASDFDKTPPRVVSVSPANLAAGVDVHTDFSMTFSKPLFQNESFIQIYPTPHYCEVTWSDDGKSFVARLCDQMDDSQQYAVTILPGSFHDLNGVANVEATDVRFTTGVEIERGGIAGTLAGDPLSDFADDPQGASVHALYGTGLWPESMEIAGLAAGGASGTYDIARLSDGEYAVAAILDSNHDGMLDPISGDAWGMLGTDIRNYDLSEITVSVTGGNTVMGADFLLVDPAAVTGSVSYFGSGQAEDFVIGLFEVNGFDPGQPPDYATAQFWYGSGTSYWMHDFFDGFPDGTYYVRAYLDVTMNGLYDAAEDPAGFYGGDTPIPIVISRGSDANDVVILLEDPGPTTSPAAVAWPVRERGRAAKMLQRLSELSRSTGSTVFFAQP